MSYDTPIGEYRLKQDKNGIILVGTLFEPADSRVRALFGMDEELNHFSIYKKENTMNKIATVIYDPESGSLSLVNDRTIVGEVDISEAETDTEIIETLNAGGSYLLPMIKSSRDEEMTEGSDFACCVEDTETQKVVFACFVKEDYGQATLVVVTDSFTSAEAWRCDSPETYGRPPEEAQTRFIQRWVVQS